MISIDLGEAISAVSIVLGVMTYFLGVVHSSTSALLKEEAPPRGQEVKRKEFRSKVGTSILCGNLPVAVGLGVLLYLCLPACVSVMGANDLAAWGFDLLPSLFVALEVAIVCCFAFATALLIRMSKHWWKAF